MLNFIKLTKIYQNKKIPELTQGFSITRTHCHSNTINSPCRERLDILIYNIFKQLLLTTLQ